MALINPQPGSSSIYDPSLPSRIAQGQAQVPQQPPNTIASTEPGQGPQYNPSFGMDESPTPAPTPSPIAAQLGQAAGRQMPFPGQVDPRGVFAPTFSPAAPAANNMPFPGQRDPRGVFAPRPPAPVATHPAAAQPSATGPGGADIGGIFNSLPDNTFDGARNAPQAAQAPQSATPQGWNLFAALGQALSHLLGFNAQGQPQGMSGLIRNPVQPAPTQTANLRMPTPVQQAARYQGRTLIG
jgi:hypothetical protein